MKKEWKDDQFNKIKEVCLWLLLQILIALETLLRSSHCSQYYHYTVIVSGLFFSRSIIVEYHIFSTTISDLEVGYLWVQRHVWKQFREPFGWLLIFVCLFWSPIPFSVSFVGLCCSFFSNFCGRNIKKQLSKQMKKYS